MEQLLELWLEVRKVSDMARGANMKLAVFILGMAELEIVDRLEDGKNVSRVLQQASSVEN